MRPRALAALGAALGAALAALAPLPWFALELPARVVATTGLAAGGELWLLPTVGLAAAVIAGWAVARPPQSTGAARWRAAAIAVLGGLGLAWSILAAVDPQVVAAVDDDGTAVAVGAPIELRPAAIVAPLVAGALCAASLAMAWRQRPR